MSTILSASHISKTYDTGFTALQDVNLDIERNEIFALLGPNGAGKTTLISIICGLVSATSGTVTVDGHDVVRDYRAARSLIGLVPQEITIDLFSTPWSTLQFSRGVFGKPADNALAERILKDLSLYDKKDAQLGTLSGGMKRRVMIAKALVHEPRVLFLDEPTAGVDVELRRGMWEVVDRLREEGVTIILTTHYIEEAEEMADRVGVISAGRIVLVEDKATLMKKLGKKQLTLALSEKIDAVPEPLSGFDLALEKGGTELVYTYDTRAERTGITRLLAALAETGIRFNDLSTDQSSLEDIFVSLVKDSQ